MLRERAWRSGISLAAAVVLGWGALLPAQAQQAAEQASAKSALASLKPAKVEGDLFYGKLENFEIYILREEQASEPPFVILRNVDAGWNSKAAFQKIAERFQEAYKLQDYSLHYAEDGSAAFFQRKTSSYTTNLYRALNEASLAELVCYLNKAFKSAPHHMEDSKLIWQRKLPAPRSSSRSPSRTTKSSSDDGYVEVSLNLLERRPPCLYIRQVDIEPEQISSTLGKVFSGGLPSTPRNRVGVVRRRLGYEPIGYLEGRVQTGKRRRMVAICLVPTPRVENAFRLSTLEQIKKLNAQGATETSLPTVESVSWPDDAPDVATSTPVSTTPDTTAPKSTQVDTTAQPKEEPEKAKGAPSAAATPAEAFKKYSERLKAL